jgi:hypothetical protein
MPKRYSPIRICDPHEGHTVPLLPNQGFSICLTGDKTQVEHNSPFFELSDTIYKNDTTTFNFVQKHDLTTWSRISRVFLGEVVTLAATAGSVCVFLESSNQDKSNFVTVINPHVNFIKVDATTVLELVIYDTNFFGTWECTVISGDHGIKYEQLEYRQLDPRPGRSLCYDPSDSYSLYPRSNLFGDVPLREHHYWFRVDYASMVSAAYLPGGLYSAGKIIFDSGCNVFKVLNPQINIREKNKTKLFGLGKQRPAAGSMTILLPQPQQECGLANRIRKYIPQTRDSIFKQDIVLKKKECHDLDSHRVVYF